MAVPLSHNAVFGNGFSSLIVLPYLRGWVLQVIKFPRKELMIKDAKPLALLSNSV